MIRARARVRARARLRERGIALVMVLATMTVLMVMLAEFQVDTSVTVAAGMADRDTTQAEYIARSAINLSRLLIATEPSIRATIAPLFMMMKRTPPQLPVWEFSDKLLAPFNDSDSASVYTQAIGVSMTSAKNLGMPNGRFEVTTADEDAKINVNLGAANDIAHIRLAKELMGLMAPIQYNPLFEQRDGAGQFNDRLSVCQALIDWSDVDESAFSCDVQANAPTGAAVEDAYYQLLPHPYRRKNSPYDSVAEIHMIRGISDDYWSTFVDPDPSNPQKRVMTVWGQGAVNVNTANAQTLLAVVCSGAKTGTEICTDPAQASLFLMGVTMARGITMGAPLFGNAQDFIMTMKGEGMLGPMLTGIGMKKVAFLSDAEFAKSITTESKVFSIEAVGIIKGYKRETRVKIATVVDFRGAPSLSVIPSGSPTAAPTTTGTSGSKPPDPNSIAAAMQPSTGGAVLYYRID